MGNSLKHDENVMFLYLVGLLSAGAFVRRGFYPLGLLSVGAFIRGAFFGGAFVRGAFVRRPFVLHSKGKWEGKF